jgi:hypothetical protein
MSYTGAAVVVGATVVVPAPRRSADVQTADVTSVLLQVDVLPVWLRSRQRSYAQDEYKLVALNEDVPAAALSCATYKVLA